ncbi:hypothetical protein [Microbacterium rhizomatis]|uniref:Uncharacterized protein n=1 Tax=Microbacterium rhizomatis TaxID=1631477 RepID=A0A5J5IZA5_9MICO|nr:hypothetical protein [Microbacterium rhizomatis]KAA9106003.1 hypothetical protein F6B43_16735 [Microbacterium rhizomatis]
MKLIGVPDISGHPTIWINADHLVSVQSILRTGERAIMLEVELKIDGMPLMRINLGPHDGRVAAETAFTEFLEQLQN